MVHPVRMVELVVEAVVLGWDLLHMDLLDETTHLALKLFLVTWVHH
tara:strand:- start:215 stop:352 length:138 start_codon:yes stop_codon:yes gene_type:complete